MSHEQNIRSLLKELGSVVIGYSGGVDSTLLAYLATQELGIVVGECGMRHGFGGIEGG